MKLLSVLLLLGSVSGLAEVLSCKSNDGLELLLKTSTQKKAYAHLYLTNPKLKLVSNYVAKKLKQSEENPDSVNGLYWLKNLKTSKKAKLKISTSYNDNGCNRVECPNGLGFLETTGELLDLGKSIMFTCKNDLF